MLTFIPSGYELEATMANQRDEESEDVAATPAEPDPRPITEHHDLSTSSSSPSRLDGASPTPSLLSVT